MAPRRPALVFDFGNVVAFFDYGRAFDRLAGTLGLDHDGPTLLEEARRAGLTGLVHEYERGAIGDVEFGERALGLLELAAPAESFRAAWADIFWLNEPVVDLIGRLDDAGYPLVLGSNTNAIHAEHFLGRFAEVFERFDGLILSYRVGHLKPSAEFYLACARAAGAEPGDCLFIDDLEENVEGARRAGLKGIRYDDPEGLVAALRQQGVEV